MFQLFSPILTTSSPGTTAIKLVTQVNSKASCSNDLRLAGGFPKNGSETVCEAVC